MGSGEPSTTAPIQVQHQPLSSQSSFISPPTLTESFREWRTGPRNSTFVSSLANVKDAGGGVGGAVRTGPALRSSERPEWSQLLRKQRESISAERVRALALASRTAVFFVTRRDWGVPPRSAIG